MIGVDLNHNRHAVLPPISNYFCRKKEEKFVFPKVAQLCVAQLFICVSPPFVFCAFVENNVVIFACIHICKLSCPLVMFLL